jgi:hypothetical protein
MGQPETEPPPSDNTILFESLIGPRVTSLRVVAGFGLAVLAFFAGLLAAFLAIHALQAYGFVWWFWADLAACAAGGSLWASYRLLNPFV